MRRLAALGLALAAIVPFGARATPPVYVHIVGALHEHSGYSDGWPGSTPRDYFASAKSFGLDFLGSGEHSDSADLPTVFSENCLSVEIPSCAIADDDQPVNSFRKWDATLEYARAASDANFTGFRGFEWTSDVFGHINVYFSEHDANAKTDGGYGVTMATFYEWFQRDAQLGGGADGIATFNHPGDKCLLGKTDPTCDWNQFEYVPAADERMVGIELYNGRKDFGPYYAQALDKGWHVGAVGAEDKGHDRTDQWGSPEYAKTVLIVPDPPFPCRDKSHLLPIPEFKLPCDQRNIRGGMLDRSMYAVLDNSIRIDFHAGGELMGARIARGAGETLPLTVSAIGASPSTIQILTNGGVIVATGPASGITYDITVTGAEQWYYARILDASGKAQAYSSPVWVRAS